MIINTVILFLRDLLPLFILFSYLHIFLKNKALTYTYLSPAIILGTISSVIFFLMAGNVSELFEGTGIERVYVTLLLFSYGCLFFINLSKTKACFNASLTKSIILLGVGSFIILKVSAFIIFFDVHFQQQGNSLNIFIGCIIGVGICISFCLLFTFILTELIASNKSILIHIFWALFLAGEVSQITTYLSQVDLINIGPSVLDLSRYVQDSSEYGHVLKALIGYEESPSPLFIIIYSLAFTFPFLVQGFKTIFIKKKL